MRRVILPFLLLIAGCEGNFDKEATQALLKSVQRGDLEAARNQIAQGANVNGLHSGRSPLQIAAAEGDLQLVKLLVNHQAQIDPEVDPTKKPLALAVENGHLEVAQLLIENGAETTLQIVVEIGDLKATEDRLAKNKDQINNKEGNLPLHVAAAQGHLAMVNLLLANGADAAAKNFAGWTPLHLAARGGHKQLIRPLIEHGADVNTEYTGSGWTPLKGFAPIHFATIKGHTDLAKLLVELGANENAKDARGWTPQDWANLERLDLRDRNERTESVLTDSALEDLTSLTTLVELDLGYCTHLSDAGLIHLKDLTRLKKLDLSGTSIDGSAKPSSRLCA